MKKLKINTAAFILNIIGASFYLIALIIAFTAQNYLHLLVVINVVTMTIWLYSLGAAIVSIIALVKTKQHNMNMIGVVSGLVAHSLYFLFGIYPAIFCIALCILAAIRIQKDNHYDPKAIKTKIAKQDVIDVETIEVDDMKDTNTDENEKPIEETKE